MTDMELAEEIERRRGGTDMLNSVLMPHQWEQIIASLRRVPDAQARIAELEKDAARYRWLCKYDGTELYCDWVSRRQLGRDALDAAIDAAPKSRT